MGNEYLAHLTKQFFRKMGITAQVISGEMPGTLGSASGGRGTTDVDVQIYIERSRYQADQVTGWVEYLVKKWALANSKAKKPLARLKIHFAPTEMEMAKKIKDVLGPMYRDGALSYRTYASGAGLDSRTELKYKKEEKASRDEGLLDPPLAFKQQAITSGGQTKEVSQSAPQGSPTEDGEQRNAAGMTNKQVTEVQGDIEDE